MAVAIAGRAAEVDRVVAFVLDDAPRPRALLLEGEPGIGKTTIWREGPRRTREAGGDVLAAQPAESESRLPFAALADLVEGRLDLGPTPSSGLALSRSVLALVRELAPVVIAIDDVQWLDEPSIDVLSYVARRLDGYPVRLLLARRTGGAPPLQLDRALGDDLEALTVGPMSLTALDEVLRERLELRLPRPQLVELHRAAAGNPFYALQLARSDPDEGSAHLGAVLQARVDALPPPARDAVLLTAACMQPTVRLVERAAGGADGLALARDHEVLEVRGDRLRFTHPLLASAAYAAAASWERRDAHARLAAHAGPAIERAHQLARSVEDADADVATEIAAAADEAATAGATATAADLAEHAVRLTPVDDGALRARRMALAGYTLAAGDPDGARAILDDVLAGSQPGSERAEVLALLADVAEPSSREEAIAFAEQALREAAGDPAAETMIHLALETAIWNQGRLEAAVAHSRAALRCAELTGDETLLAMSLSALVTGEVTLGLPLDESAPARLLDLERALAETATSSYLRPSLQLGIALTAIDRIDEARALLEPELERVTAVGDEGIRWGVHVRMSDLELRAGNLGEALRHAREALALVRLLDYPGLEPYALVPLAAVAAQLGDETTTREAVATTLAQTVSASSEVRARGALGLLELSLGNAEQAWEWLEPAVDQLVEMGAGELSIFGVAQNAIEALAATGRLERAEELIAWVEAAGRPAGRAWHVAIAARGRALVADARGDLEAARAALAAPVAVAQPFEHARTLLVQGTIERRGRQRRLARAALEQALELFDALGAQLFAERAAAEIARIPGRASGSGGLTEMERRVAELVGQGLSNKEVAARLVIAVRTVEAHLSKVYAKLGVHSRTELVNSLWVSTIERGNAPP